MITARAIGSSRTAKSESSIGGAYAGHGVSRRRSGRGRPPWRRRAPGRRARTGDSADSSPVPPRQSRGDRLLGRGRGSQPLDQPGRVTEIAAGQRERELLAAVAGEDVGRPQLLAPRGGELLQQPVAGLVAVDVVVVLEPVEVEDPDAERGRPRASTAPARGRAPRPSARRFGSPVRSSVRATSARVAISSARSRAIDADSFAIRRTRRNERVDQERGEHDRPDGRHPARQRRRSDPRPRAGSRRPPRSPPGRAGRSRGGRRRPRRGRSRRRTAL